MFNDWNEVLEAKESEDLLSSKGTNAVHSGVHKWNLALFVLLSKWQVNKNGR